MEAIISILTMCVVALGLISTSAEAQEKPQAVSQAANEIDPKAPVGARPYEMVLANRTEERKPLVGHKNRLYVNNRLVRVFEGI